MKLDRSGWKPKEVAEPQHDVVLVRKLKVAMQTSRGGIAMPNASDTTGMVRGGGADDRYEVVACGPGTWSDVNDPGLPGMFLRKPMCCMVGDVVGAINGIAFPFNADGEVLFLIHDYQVTVIIRTDANGAEFAEPQHDYVLFKPNADEHVSRGGIHMPDVEDPTGNQRSSGRYDVIATGPGPWVIVESPERPTTYGRRPMCVATGDVMLFEGKGFLINVPGDQVGVVQDYQIGTVFRRAAKAEAKRLVTLS